MAHGVPQVVWDSAGPKYLVKNNIVGFKIPLGGLDEFAKKVGRLIDDEGLNFSMATASFKHSKKYSWENHGKILEGALRKYE